MEYIFLVAIETMVQCSGVPKWRVALFAHVAVRFGRSLPTACYRIELGTGSIVRGDVIVAILFEYTSTYSNKRIWRDTHNIRTGLSSWHDKMGHRLLALRGNLAQISIMGSL
jgi:hypothetical protein